LRLSSYFKTAFAADLKAGFITAVVALPLAIAFAIASGVEPVLGLYTAVITGILAALVGGSRYSITGPTAAMTIIVLSTLNRHGLEGLFLAGFLAGAIQVLLGLLKVGMVVKFIPLPVVSGFTAGIGSIIFFGQVPNMLGLTLPAREHIWQTISDVIEHSSSINLTAVIISLGTVALLLLLPKILSKVKLLSSVPASVVVLVGSVVLTIKFGLAIPLVGNIPSGLPKFGTFALNFDLLLAVLPAAFTIAMLGSIEALLCAVVCDGMTGTKHNSNRELVGQGISNMAVPFFGGIPCTAAIARSSVNVREGAKTRFAAVYHAIFLLLIFLYLGHIAKFIPKAFLAGILIIVSARMINFKELKTIARISQADLLVYITTFALTAATDLVFAVQIGMVLSVFLLFMRVVKLTDIYSMEDYHGDEGINISLNSNPGLRDNVSVFTIQGPFFFGAMSIFDGKVDQHSGSKAKMIILRMKYVPFIDSTGIERLKEFIEQRQKANSVVLLSSLTEPVEKKLKKDVELAQLFEEKRIFPHTQDAIRAAKKHLDLIASVSA
jgi:SulP family sulfate permease